MTLLRPIYLLADSSLLFSKGGSGTSLCDRIAREVTEGDASAAYVGASSNDDPDFFAIFEAAMDAVGIARRRHVRARYSAMDHMCLRNADVIVLGGGDVAHGWEAIAGRGMREAIVERYYEGALLLGVSAGAVQLGVGLGGDPPLETFRLVPFLVDVHDEERDWGRLAAAVRARGGTTHGLGIPHGAGAAFHADHSLEPLGKPLTELRLEDDAIVETLLFPPTDAP